MFCTFTYYIYIYIIQYLHGTSVQNTDVLLINTLGTGAGAFTAKPWGSRNGHWHRFLITSAMVNWPKGNVDLKQVI